VLVVFLVRIVGLSAGVTGLLIALTSLGGVLGALLARPAARRFGSARAVLRGRILLGPAGLLIPLADRGPGLALFVLGSVTVIGSIIAGNVIWGGWLQGYYPGELLGRVSTSMQVFNYGSIPLGAVVAGALASDLGVRVALWIMLSGLALSALILLTGPLRHLRDLPARPANSEAQTAQRGMELPESSAHRRRNQVSRSVGPKIPEAGRCPEPAHTPSSLRLRDRGSGQCWSRADR
jgi:MFS family permease